MVAIFSACRKDRRGWWLVAYGAETVFLGANCLVFHGIWAQPSRRVVLERMTIGHLILAWAAASAKTVVAPSLAIQCPTECLRGVNSGPSQHVTDATGPP